MTLWQIISDIRSLLADVRRLKQQMSAQTDEIAEIKANIVTYQTNVNTKIAALEAQLAAQTDPAVQAALDDLKATASALVVPA